MGLSDLVESKRVMQSRYRIQTNGPNNGHQLRDYSKSSNRSEKRPDLRGIYILNGEKVKK